MDINRNEEQKHHQQEDARGARPSLNENSVWGSGVPPTNAGWYQHLEAICSVAELVKGMRAIRGPGFSSPGREILLIAEDGVISLFATWGYNRIVYQIRAQVQHSGCVALPMRRVNALSTSFRPRARRGESAHAARHVELSGEARLSIVAVTHRRRPTQAFLQIECPGIAATQLIAIERGDWLEDYEQFITTRDRFLLPPLTERSITFSVNAAWLKLLFQRVVFAAQQWYPYRDKTVQDFSPWYGVLLRFAPNREQGSDGQRVTCLAGDGNQFAVVRHRAFLPFARTLTGQPFHGEIGIPSWTLVELIPLLPEGGVVQITRSGPWIVFRLSEAVLVAPLIEYPREVPSLGTNQATMSCSVSASLLLTELRRVSHEIEAIGVPWERRRIRIVLSPGIGHVKIEPATLGLTSSPIPHAVPILPPARGEERSLYIFTNQVEQMLSNIRGPSWRRESGQTANIWGSVLLSFYDPPAPFTFSMQPQVRNGYFYATRLLEVIGAQEERRDHPPETELTVSGEHQLIIHQLQSDCEGAYYQVENRSTSEHSPYGWCTVEVCAGVATECICGGNTTQPCTHMQRLDQTLAESKRRESEVP